jgi:uncharacterized protein (DUF1330 family)
MKAYLVLDLVVHNSEEFQEYIEKIPALIEKHQGRYLVQGVIPEVIEGDWQPERVVILEFASKQNVTDFFADTTAQKLFKIRHSAATSKVIMAEGCLA